MRVLVGLGELALKLKGAFVRLFFVSVIFLFSSVLAAQPQKTLNAKTSSKVLDLLAQGGAARVYTTHITAVVGPLNCRIDRALLSRGNANAATCTGVRGNKNFQWSGEKAQSLFQI